MRFVYRLEPTWPVQAWLAECGPDGVIVRHGKRVETRDDWFCEAVWDGSFEQGDFDRTDIVAGSGGRIRDGKVVFVPAGSTTDRLQSIRVPASGADRWGKTLISNSLAGLLAVAGARIHRTYRHYRRDIQTVALGLTRYKKTLGTTLGPVRLWYFNNVRWDGRGLTELEKPNPQRDFSTFEAYYDFLDRAMAGFTRNMADPARTIPVGLMGTMSSGYDSTTVATLARDHGLRQFITLDTSRGGNPDSGLESGKHLGLEPILVKRDDWKQFPLPEVPFLVAGGNSEDRFILGAQQHLYGKVLLTGFHGDKIWSKNPYKTDSLIPHPEIKRGDCSGLTTTEFRLSAGYMNCPVPFWGARQIHELVALSRHPSMRPWDVPGDYSRPICRRIVESAGVPRHAFGSSKRMATVLEAILVDSSRQDYEAWCRRCGIEGNLLDRVIRKAIRTIPQPARGKVRHMFYSRTPTFRDFYFPWAVERRMEAYRTASQAPAAAAAPAARRRDEGWRAQAPTADDRVAVAV